ncbi:unnamed protein product [Moneuplotes crassus]|uniref:Uncharacterized protein n=1 Tax=Euplotes crassus TaxID=5936 RepID=A0AAD1Y1X1_EUPCR|nr:unnamed protein product [Moneuplotes crassus]
MSIDQLWKGKKLFKILETFKVPSSNFTAEVGPGVHVNYKSLPFQCRCELINKTKPLSSIE